MPLPHVLLINPPLWNVYAPHLAVPLLAGALRQWGHVVRALDLGIETHDWLLSPAGLARLAPLLLERARSCPAAEARLVERAHLLLPSVLEEIEPAKATLRSLQGVQDAQRYCAARSTLRNALCCVSAAFPSLRFDLVANEQLYTPRSTRSVLDATTDPLGNVYRFAFDVLLPPHLVGR